MDEKAWWLALHLVPGVGRITFKKLIGYFGHPRDVMKATTGQLMRVSRIGPKLASAITGFQTTTEVERELRAAKAAGCQIITQGDAAYPSLLRAIEDPPPILYVRGDVGEWVAPG